MDKVLVYEMWPLQVNDYKEKSGQLPMFKELGATYVWLRSNDRRYPVDDEQFERLRYFEHIGFVHGLGMKLMIDLDINLDSNKDYDEQIENLRKTAHRRIDDGIDGFYLNADSMQSETTIRVLNDVFSEPFRVLTSIDKLGNVEEKDIKPFLIIGSNDNPSDDYNFEKFKDTPIDYVDNRLIKNVGEEDDPLKVLVHRISKACTLPKTAVSLQTYGSKRITSVVNISPAKLASALFMNGPDCIILYQGQELDMKDINTSYKNTFEFQKRSNNSALSWYKFYSEPWKKQPN